MTICTIREEGAVSYLTMLNIIYSNKVKGVLPSFDHKSHITVDEDLGTQNELNIEGKYLDLKYMIKENKF